MTTYNPLWRAPIYVSIEDANYDDSLECTNHGDALECTYSATTLPYEKFSEGLFEKNIF
jgi:hypothetical protein